MAEPTRAVSSDAALAGALRRKLVTRLALTAASSVGFAWLASACATTPTVTPARRAEINAAAQACQREHPSIEQYEVNQFGYVTGTYRQSRGQTGDVEPFFTCIRARLGAPPVATPPKTPETSTSQPPAPTPVAAPSPVSAAAVGRWPVGLPLPEDVAVRSPAPYVIPALHPFIGRWAGTADQGRAAAGLVVEELRPPIAIVVVSLMFDGLGQARRREARVQSDTLTLVVEGFTAGSAIRYRLQADGTLHMRLEDGGQLVTMTLRRVREPGT